MKSVVLLLLLGASGIVGQSNALTSAEVDRTRAQVRLALARGSYGEAERVSRELSERVKEQQGATSLDFARSLDLVVEALIRNGKAGSSTTFALAEQVVQLKEQHAGRDDLETATSLHNLAAVHVEHGQFVTALPLHERALSIRANQLAPDSPVIADSLDHLALPLILLQRFDEARTRLERSLAIREAAITRAPLSIAGTLELMAMLQRYSGYYRAAMPLLDRAMVIRRELSPDHPDIASALNIRGDVVWLEGSIAEAQRTWAEALALGEKTLGPQHVTISLFLRKLGLAAAALGNLAEARRLRQRALEIGEPSLAPCHPEVAWLLNDLAESDRSNGEYIEAQKLYQREVATIEKCLGPDHANVATALFNEAELAALIGDFVAAERLYGGAIRIWSARLGRDHPYVARGLDALAEVLTSSGQRNRARGLYERALAIRRQTVGPNHPDVAWTLTNLARLKAAAGHVESALSDVEQATDIYRRVGVSDEPDHFARLLALRGQIEARRGNYTTARASFVEALSTRERIFGEKHPLAAESRSELASTDFAMRSYGGALRAALDAERDGRDQLRFIVRYLPERQAMTYADKRPRGLDLALSILADGHGNDLPAIFDSVVQSRAVILDELAARARSAAGSDPELASLNTSLVATRQRFANLMLRSLGESLPASRKMLDEARQQKEDAETALAQRSVAVREELVRAAVGLTDVRTALPRGSALVSFVRYDRTSIVVSSGGASRALKASAYVAFVLQPGHDDVVVLPVGSAAAIDGLVARWRQETTGIMHSSSAVDAEGSYRVAGAALRQRVWDPLRRHLVGASTVFIVPDGSLNLVSFAALPVGQSSYLIDRGPVIHYLSAERDLVVNQQVTPAAGGLLAVGGAAFDDASSFARVTKKSPAAPTASASDAPLVASLRSGCGTFQSVHFEPLGGTGREVRQVAALWKDSPADILEGRGASERAFKREAPGRRVIHLATHGFFLDDACSTPAAGTRSVGGLAPARKRKATPGGLSDNPLLLSGLALAGANRRVAAGPDDEDGILTAEEVTALNLAGVEWAVLSACDTGLGEVKAGEGVFGLRRAFQVAGVRTVIMSLWPVDDDAARLWMRALYQGRLQNHLNTAEAMRAASSSVLRERRARRQSTHPFYWAAFVAAGDWR